MIDLLSSLEIAINRLLPLDPCTEQRVTQLQGKSIAFSAVNTPFSATLLFTDGRIAVTSGDQQSPTVHIEGPLNKIVSLALSKSETLVAEGVRIRGDQSLLLELKQILHNLDLDWEEPIAQRVGDIAAHKVGGWLRNLFQWSKEAGTKLIDTSENYITHELPETVRPEAVEHYLEEVDRINADTERLKARVLNAEQQLHRTATEIAKKTSNTDQDSAC